jgi:hypothetical protein
MNSELSKIFLEGETPAQEKSPQANKRKIPQGKNKRWLPKTGYAWNPLFAHMERNEPCLCGSGAKWKKCCMRSQPRVVTQNAADHMVLRIEAMKARRDTPITG